MRNIITKLFRIILIILLPLLANSQDLLTFLNGQKEIKAVNEMESNSFFSKTYEIMVRQPLNYKDTTDGFFLQRVFVADRGVDKPTVLITEGYGANYAASSKYINELCPILDANQVFVEHRYFAKSTPEPLNWDYLTVENAVNDHHRIFEIFKRYYHSKWVATGISKGGQTAMSYRKFFPNDVDVTVSYVAPLNFEVEDGRHEPFISQMAGNAGERKKILEFQKEVLKRKTQMIPLLEKFSAEKKYTYSVPMQEVLDFCVLEYSFAFWQWGNSVKEIPKTSASDEELFNHLMKIASSDYFAIEGIAPTLSFFVQAARELGYYGYDTEPFKGLLTIDTANGYLKRVFLSGIEPIKFMSETMNELHQFLQNTDKKMIFIYGEDDPWSATAVNLPKKDNLIKVIKKGGSHRSRIENLTKKQKNRLIETLKVWMN